MSLFRLTSIKESRLIMNSTSDPVEPSTPHTAQLIDEASFGRAAGVLGYPVEVPTASETQSRGASGQHVTPSFGSTRQSTSKNSASSTQTAADHDEKLDNNNTGSCTRSESPLQQCIPNLSSGTFHRGRELDQNFRGSRSSEPWVYPPVSFIPEISPLGPRELALDHYNCPVSECGSPHGPLNSIQGYHWTDLGPHIYFRHGLGPGVDAVRLKARNSVMSLRSPQGKDIGVVPEPCAWANPMRDLQRASRDLVSDLEEIRNWERSLWSEYPRLEEDICLSRTSVGVGQKPVPQMEDSTENGQKTPEPEQNTESKAVISKRGEVISRRRMAKGDKVRQKVSPDTGKKFDSLNQPNSQTRANRFARLRDNRFHRSKESSLLHTKEMTRSPPKKQSGDTSSARRVGDLLEDGRKTQPHQDESEKENWEPKRKSESLEIF